MLITLSYIHAILYTVYTGSDDQTVRLWEVSTGRCMSTLNMAGKVSAVVWNPNETVSLVAVAV